MTCEAVLPSCLHYVQLEPEGNSAPGDLGACPCPGFCSTLIKALPGVPAAVAP